MKRTKAFSYDSKDDIWFQRLAREARRERRSQSAQLVYVIQYFFDHKRLIKNVVKTQEVSENG